MENQHAFYAAEMFGYEHFMTLDEQSNLWENRLLVRKSLALQGYQMTRDECK